MRGRSEPPDRADASSAALRAGDETSATLASLGDSMRGIGRLTRQLASVPQELRQAPDRAVQHRFVGLPVGGPGRLWRRLRALALPLAAVLTSAGAGAAVVALAGGG